MDVDANDLFLDTDQLNAMLREGQLRSTDLAKVGDEWVCLVDFEPAQAEALRAEKREKTRRALRYTGTVFLIILGYVFIIYTRGC